MTELHVLLVVNGRHGDLALRHVVVVVNVVAQQTRGCKLQNIKSVNHNLVIRCHHYNHQTHFHVEILNVKYSRLISGTWSDIIS